VGIARTFSLFAVNGIVTAIVYSAIAWSVLVVEPGASSLAVVIAYAGAVAVNYLGSRIVFHAPPPSAPQLGRYFIVVAGNGLTAFVVASALKAGGSQEWVTVYGPVLVTMIPSFALMRWWVFGASGHRA
jgi:putative flippase GtrA